MTEADGRRLSVLRIYHSGVVDDWRERERRLRADGADVDLISPECWNEGGAPVELQPGADRFVIPVRTFGHHPNLFVYEPIGMWRALRRHRDVDVLDIHEEPVSVASAEVQLLACLAGLRTPFCLYSAQNLPKRYPIPFRWMERVALRRATAVHTCNEAAGDILRAKGFRGVVENLGLGFEASEFTPPAEPRTGGNSVRVGYVGRLASHKGVDVLVDAVAALPNVALDLVGDGPAREELVARVSRSGASDRITFHGFVAHQNLPEWYRRFDVLAVPSLETPSWIEQFCRVAVEAMATGVPVVASASGSLPEVVDDGGVLVPPGDVEALRATLAALLRDPDRLVELGKRAEARSVRYSWHNIALRQRALYEEMVRRGR
jgi:glycosyltransferase involved in cell wall biosynthesis